jgi:hypothetical protein
MTKSDQTASAAGQLGWPKAGTERAARSGESVFGASLTVCGLVVLLLEAGRIWRSAFFGGRPL